MKHYLRYFGVLAFFFMSLSSLSAQTSNSSSISLQIVTPEDEVMTVYGREWVSANRPMVDALIDCRRTRISFTEQSPSDNEKYPKLSAYPVMNKFNPEVQPINPASFNVNTFNPFTYRLDFLSDRTQVIRIDGTNYIMTIQPRK